ncbi:MAG: homoserine dehydrogenase [Spirochaetales bacterium]|nr:homoserine dehydrogenase [Spirochaetales bacterium]
MSGAKDKIKVAIVGCGVVGGSVAKMLTQQKDYIGERSSVELELAAICDLDFSRAEKLGIDSSLFMTDYREMLKNEEISIVVELVGGLSIAKEIIIAALKAGKQVVTANKALLAHYGPELYRIARENRSTIAFEASCGGGIPIIRALLNGLLANRIDAFYGIVNGTSNYILSSMTQVGISYEEALRGAQEAGFAEADPALDVQGGDSAHKLAIMAALAFGKSIDLEKIAVSGIDKLDIRDIEYGTELGYVVKLLAIAQRHEKGISLYVRPAFISIEHPLAWVSGPFNAVSVYGHSTGHTMHYGRGAGGDPTASAIIADLYQSAMGITRIQYDKLCLWPDMTSPAVQLPPDEIESRYYIRISAQDSPGVLSKIAEKFASQNISLASVLQQEMEETQCGENVPIIITTHWTKEGSMMAALAEIDAMDAIIDKSICISIIDEHEEELE